MCKATREENIQKFATFPQQHESIMVVIVVQEAPLLAVPTVVKPAFFFSPDESRAAFGALGIQIRPQGEPHPLL